jgi:hypothetical protein
MVGSVTEAVFNDRRHFLQARPFAITKFEPVRTPRYEVVVDDVTELADAEEGTGAEMGWDVYVVSIQLVYEYIQKLGLTYRSHRLFQNFPSAKNSFAMGWVSSPRMNL